jgi:heat-inducible transcriptional repressor
MKQYRQNILGDLDSRARDIFSRIVETYIETGEPVGSRTLSLSGLNLSPATIRNTMSDLANIGLLDSPHISAGRAPTHLGLRLFVDGLLEVSEILQSDKDEIDTRIDAVGDDISQALTEASSFLSGIANGAGLVTTPNVESAVSHVEFVKLGATQILVVLVFQDGRVENRFVNAPIGITASQLIESTNYINHHLRGRTLSETLSQLIALLKSDEREIDAIAARLIQDGLAQWSGGKNLFEKKLIVRGRSNLLNDADLRVDLERVRVLFDELEKKRDLIAVLDAANSGAAVKLFIGAENPLFALSGSALIAAPYMDAQNRVIGALGVIGPTRINYARVIPIVDYTAKILTKMVEKRQLITK